MAPADAVAIVTYDGGAVRVREDFTDDRDRLIARLRLLAAGGDGNADGLADELEAASAFGENDAEFNVFSTDRQLAALQSAIRQLRPIPEQKALVYFGSGLRLNGVGNQAQIRATVNAAVRANVTINPIDARGLVALAPMGDATRATPGGVALFSGTLAQNAANRFQRSQDTLHALATDTGGQALFDHNDLTLGVVQAAEAVSSYYLLGYYSTETSDDGRFRRVRVSVRNRPGATLAYRDGYAGDKVFGAFTAADRERQLEEALRLDDPVTEVTLAVEVNTFRLNRSEYYVPVSVKITGRELSLARRRGAPRTLIDVIGEVKDEHGVTHRNLRDRLDIRLDQERAAVWTQRPIQYETGFTLLPGTYVLKVLVRDATTGRIGTYQAPFSIRNAERDTDVLPISSVVLGAQRLAVGEALHTVQQAISTSRVNPLIVDGRQLLPSVTRVFSVTRDLHVLLHAYRTATITPEPLLAYAALYRDDLKLRETPPLIVGSVPAGPKSPGVPVMLMMPLGGLDPGPYECQVTLLSPASGKVAFWRADVVLTK
jgi:VWFA-related protein